MGRLIQVQCRSAREGSSWRLPERRVNEKEESGRTIRCLKPDFGIKIGRFFCEPLFVYAAKGDGDLASPRHVWTRAPATGRPGGTATMGNNGGRMREAGPARHRNHDPFVSPGKGEVIYFIGRQPAS